MSREIRFGKYIRGALTFGDFVVLNIALALTVFFTIRGYELASKWIILIANIAFIPSALSYSHIHNNRIFFADKVVITAIKSSLLQIACMMALMYFFDIFTVSTTEWVCFGVFFTILLTLWWILSRRLLRRFRRMGFNYKRTIIIGSGLTAREVASELASDGGYGYRLMGVFDDEPINADDWKKFPGLQFGSLDEVSEFIKERRIDTIYYTLDAENEDLVRRSILSAEEHSADFFYIPRYNKLMTGQFHLSNVGDLPAMVHSLSPLNRRLNRMAKRTLDLCISVPFMLVSPIIFIPIAVAIKLTSPGPIFFKQKRTGIHGTEFVCYKFRTMRVNAESDSRQATSDDPRKTKLGDFLRRSSLDELPQFFNVLIGNMSVVGPRPHMILHTEEYSRLIEKYMVRHSVKPGITGWAQVSGYRGSTKELWQMEKRVEYDVWYIRNWNIFLDLKIIFLTMFNAFRGEQNAY